MKVSLICTVLNEGKSVAALLDSILCQTRPPDEVVIVDGGSKDGTLETLRSYQGRLPLKVLVDSGCNISRGRNLAIQEASGDIIASTDAGVRLSPAWLESLLACLGREPSAAVACGFFRADPQSTFEAALGATTLPGVEEIDPSRFLPSSRSVAFLREAWAAAGGYPEWLDYCEDLLFDLKLRELGYGFAWAPTALAHFRPRPSLTSFFRQYYRYARGDGKAGLWRQRHAIRYSSYVIGAAAVAAGLWQPWIWLVPLAGAAAYLYQPYLRLSRQLGAMPSGQRVKAILWAPVIRSAGDIAKMLGYPVGVWWRWRRGRASRT